MKVNVWRDVNCPQEQAFAYYSDRDKDLEWWQGTQSSEVTSAIRGGVGEKSHQVQRLFGLPITFEIDIEVISWEKPRRWREICRNALTTYDVWYVVEKVDDRRSRVGLVGNCQLNGVFKLMYPLAWLALKVQTKANFDLLKHKLDALGSTAAAPLAA